MAAAQTAMNRIWFVPVGELPTGIEKRARAVLALGVIGLGTIGATIVANLGSLLPDLGIVSRLGILAGALVVNVGVFAVAFKVLTSRPLSVRELDPGRRCWRASPGSCSSSSARGTSTPGSTAPATPTGPSPS